MKIFCEWISAWAGKDSRAFSQALCSGEAGAALSLAGGWDRQRLRRVLGAPAACRMVKTAMSGYDENIYATGLSRGWLAAVKSLDWKEALEILELAADLKAQPEFALKALDWLLWSAKARREGLDKMPKPWPESGRKAQWEHGELLLAWIERGYALRQEHAAMIGDLPPWSMGLARKEQAALWAQKAQALAQRQALAEASKPLQGGQKEFSAPKARL